MALLGCFIGVLAGLFLVKDFSFVSVFSGAALFFVGYLLTRRQKVVRMEIVGLLIGSLVGCLRFIPYPEASEVRGIVVEAKGSYYVLWTGIHKYYVYEKDSLREVGDILCLKGKTDELAFTTYESRFDFKSYLESNGIFRSFVSRQTTVLFSRPWRLREKEALFLADLNYNAKPLADMILFSHRETGAMVVGLASSLGLIGVISSSGIIYGSIVRGIEKLFFIRFDERKSKRIAIYSASAFLFFSPFKIGACRSYLMRVFSYMNTFKFRKKFSYLEIVSIIGLFLLLINPYHAYQTGYLLGFAICFYNYFSSIIVRRNKCEFRSAIQLLVVYLVVFPISLSGSVLHFLYPFFSAMMIPLISVYAGIGWIAFLNKPIIPLLNNYSNFLFVILRSMNKLDFSIPLTAPSGLLVSIYYLCLFFVFYFWGMRHIGMVIKLFIANMALYGYTLVPIVPTITSEVTFINVGQGDSILIRDGGHAALLDTGGNISFDMAQEVLVPYLRKRQIYRLDYLIASHGDFDHIGAKDSLLAHFNVGEFIDSASSFPLTFGNVVLTNYNDYGGSEENDKSLVIGTDFIGKKWLFMGDAPKEIERRIIRDYPNLDCDILKAGHHGSKTSSCLEFLEAVTPETAIISVGYKNHYGHPDKEVIDRLNRLGIRIRRTDVEGTISYQKYAWSTL